MTGPERKRSRRQPNELDQSCILVCNLKENLNSLGVAMEQLKQINEDVKGRVKCKEKSTVGEALLA